VATELREARDRLVNELVQELAAPSGDPRDVDLDSQVAETADPSAVAASREDRLMGMVRGFLEIESLGEMTEEPQFGAERRLMLWRLLCTAEIPQASRDFLQVASLCFVAGLDGPGVAYCRSAVETVLRERVTDDLCAKHEESAARFGFTLRQRIHVAEKEGILDKAARTAAISISERANKSIHDNPHATKNVFDTIEKTMLIIRKLAH
jgi:hypothetical protein